MRRNEECGLSYAVCWQRTIPSNRATCACECSQAFSVYRGTYPIGRYQLSLDNPIIGFPINLFAGVRNFFLLHLPHNARTRCASTSSPPPKEEKKETFIRKSCHAQNDYDSVSFNPFLFHLTNSFLKNFFFLLVDNDVRRPMHEKSELAAMACSTHTVVVVDLLPVIKFYPGLGCS